MNQAVEKNETTKFATGVVVKAYGNLLQVKFKGDIRQGEVAMVNLNGLKLKAEVIEIVGDEAKIQVYEDTREIRLGTDVEFSGDLLEAELGPGLLSSIFDGLENPLVEVAEISGYFLTRGVYLPALDRKRHWDIILRRKKDRFCDAETPWAQRLKDAFSIISWCHSPIMGSTQSLG